MLLGDDEGLSDSDGEELGLELAVTLGDELGLTEGELDVLGLVLAVELGLEEGEIDAEPAGASSSAPALLKSGSVAAYFLTLTSSNQE